MSHTFIVSSLAEAAIQVPWGINLQRRTYDLCSVNALLHNSSSQRRIALIFPLDLRFFWFYRKSSSWENPPAEKGSTLGRDLSALWWICACRSLRLSPLHKIVPNLDLSVVPTGNDAGGTSFEEHIIYLLFMAHKLNLKFQTYTNPSAPSKRSAF